MSKAKPIHGAASRAFASQLRDERDRLREALQPFAERWEYFERTKHPSGGEWPEDLEYADDEPSTIYLGQLKAAKAALTPAGQRWTKRKEA